MVVPSAPSCLTQKCCPKLCSGTWTLLLPPSSKRLFGSVTQECWWEPSDSTGWVALQSLALWGLLSVSRVSVRDSQVDKVDFGLDDLESPESLSSRFWIFNKHQVFSSSTKEIYQKETVNYMILWFLGWWGQVAGTKRSKLGICGLRFPVQMCMLPLGIFKGLQINKDGTSLWKAVSSPSYHLLDMNMLLPMQLRVLCQGWLV